MRRFFLLLFIVAFPFFGQTIIQKNTRPAPSQGGQEQPQKEKPHRNDKDIPFD